MNTQPRYGAQHLRDPESLYPWFRGLVIASIVTALITALMDLRELVYGAPSVDDVSAEADTYYAFAGLLALVSLAAMIGAIVLTCRMTYRMMRNLHALGSPDVSISPPWSVGWYFVPVANLFVPVRVITQMWDATFNLAGEPGRPSMALWWWTAWLVSNVLDMASLRLLMESGGFETYGPTDMETYNLALLVGVVSTLVYAAAGGLLIAVFGPMSAAQTQILRSQTFR